MQRISRTLLAILMICCALHSASAAERFFVNIQADQSQLESVKRRSEYRMSKNVDFCRGVKMPKPTGAWMCKKTSTTTASCSLQYECTFVDKNFNRKSESFRTYRAMKSVPAITTSYQISLSSKSKFIKAAATKRVAQTKVAPRVRPTPRPTPVPTPQPQIEEDLFAEEIEPQQEQKQEDVFEQAFAQERPEPKKEETFTSNEPGVSEWSWLRFDVALTQTSEETGSQSVFEAAWRPRWKFSNDWSSEIRVGLSQRKTVADTEDEAFSVLETALWLGRDFGSWHLAGGLGRQSWSGEGELGSQTPTFLGASVAYLWSETKFLSIEGLEFQYLSISDEAASTSMRFGFLFKF
tara:strand:- start:26223 stop:27275 length:1053 start_codon:yes stop_codon:yes gene_type:complete